jgi:hypothetical protein
LGEFTTQYTYFQDSKADNSDYDKIKEKRLLQAVIQKIRNFAFKIPIYTLYTTVCGKE